MLCIFVADLYRIVTAWGWGASWAFVAIGAYLALGLASGDLRGRRPGAMETAVRELSTNAPLPPEAMRRAHDPVLWLATNAIAAVTLGIVFLMTLEPGSLGALVALVVALVVVPAVGLLVGLLTQRRVAVAVAVAVAATAASDEPPTGSVECRG